MGSFGPQEGENSVVLLLSLSGDLTELQVVRSTGES